METLGQGVDVRPRQLRRTHFPARGTFQIYGEVVVRRHAPSMALRRLTFKRRVAACLTQSDQRTILQSAGVEAPCALRFLRGEELMSEARPLALGLGGGSTAAMLEFVAFEARLERARERRANVLAPTREEAATTTVDAPSVWGEPLGTVLRWLPLLLAGLGTGAALASLLLLPQARPGPTVVTSIAMLAPLSGPALDGLPPASLGPTAATSSAMLAPLTAPTLDGLPSPALWVGWIDRPATPAPLQAAVEAARTCRRVPSCGPPACA